MKPFSEDIIEQEDTHFEHEEDNQGMILNGVKDKIISIAESVKEGILGKSEVESRMVYGSALLEKGIFGA